MINFFIKIETPMNILVVDDHPIFSAGLRELLLSVCPEVNVMLAKDYESASEQISKSTPLLVLLDIDLNGENGIELIEALHQQDKALKIAMLSASENVSDMRACIEKGAIGYIPKSLEPDTLLKAIEILSVSGSYFPTNLLPYLLNTNSSHQSKLIQKGLFTVRQSEVVEYLKKGKSNKVIALDLGISEGTVKLHVSAILEKLQVSNRSEALIALN